MSGIGKLLVDPWYWVPAPPEDPLGARSPEVIADLLETIAFFVERWHETVVEGLENVPDGPALLVGNHNGGTMAPDMFALMVAWWRRRGVEEPAYGLMHDAAFRLVPVGRMLSRLGAVPAHPDHARQLLRRGAKVLVYPGGDIDAYRPAARRGEIVFGQRRGFVRVALRAGVPIVPVVSAGAHDALYIATDGRELVRKTGLKKLLRIEVLPVSFGLPWGVFLGTPPYLPLPVRMKVRVLEPMRWEGGPELADDPDAVLRLREEVRERMQAALDEMIAEGRWGRRPLSGLFARERTGRA
ncbi:MAG: acyltransferase family protein [Deltaproteobacteria bacterium]|nr:acyltransferase family protein [Deltaproteobacteria bacterium]